MGMLSESESFSELQSSEIASPYWSIFFQLEGIAFLLATPFAIFLAWFADPVMDFLPFLLFCGVVATPLCLIFARARTRYLRKKYEKVLPKSNNPLSISEPLFPKSAAAYWLIFFMLEGVMFIVAFCTTLFFVELLEALLIALVVAHLASLVIAPFFLIFSIIPIGYLRQKMGYVHFNGETISVFDGTFDREYAANLSDCRWFVGRKTWVTVPIRGNLFGAGPDESLLIVFPDFIKTPEYRIGRRMYAEGPAIIAVGLTLEARFKWEQTIERLNVERDVYRETTAPPMSMFFAMLWATLGFHFAVPRKVDCENDRVTTDAVERSR
jgi:hypothetical protein